MDMAMADMGMVDIDMVIDIKMSIDQLSLFLYKFWYCNVAF